MPEVQWNLVSLRQSWRWTCRSIAGVVPLMEDDNYDLIAQLCTRIGMIMEDASVVALTMGGQAGHSQRHYAITALEAAAVRIGALLGAVNALAI